jgi:hypothetical protein
MLRCEGKNYLVVAREDLSGRVEEDVVCRHGCFKKLVVDRGPKNKGGLGNWSTDERLCARLS